MGSSIPVVRVAHGPLALEGLLERDVVVENGLLRADVLRLRTPIVIVVPSRSLRVHVARKVAGWCGGAAAGWRIVTLFGLAREVCGAGGVVVPRGARLFEPMVARIAEGVGGLGSTLTAFEDGARVAAATVADLVDAGFVSSTAPDLLRELDTCRRSATADEIERARVLVEIAASVVRESESMGVGRAAAMLRCAANVIGEEGVGVRAREVWIHGFSDATGAAAGLLAALTSCSGVRVFWDACADGSFGSALRRRLAVDVGAVARVGVPVCELVRASSVDVEARSVADRVRARIDGGAEAESIGVVARDLGPYRVALRRHFERLSIPFSGAGAAGPDGPVERRTKALAECVARGGECSVDRWLDARGPRSFSAHGARPYELRIALRAIGVSTVAGLAELKIEEALGGRSSLLLPLRGITTVENCDDEEGDGATDEADEPVVEGPDARSVRPRVALTRREIGGADIVREIALARKSVELLDHLPEKSRAGAVLQRVRSFATEVLSTDEEDMDVLEAALRAVASDVPKDVELFATDLRGLIERELIAEAARPIGGAGAGVACLNVVEARARTFDALFVMGLVRGRFPRNVREDPLLPDAVREAWTRVLPHLPVKSVGRDEERVLFDQLVRSARTVHLSWTTLDAENKALLPSPLLERVATHAQVAAAPLAREALAHADSNVTTPRPAHEHAVSAALRAGIDGLEVVLPIAVAETRARFGLDAAPSRAIASARVAVLREHEPSASDRATLGPYFGMIGQLATRNDLRYGDLHVTQLEGVAACGWKTLLTRVLRLEPPLDPLDSLPDLDARLVGDVVHAVLQHVVDGMKSAVKWPTESRVEELLQAAAHSKLRDRGTFVPGFEALIATRARPMLLAARALDESEPVLVRSARSEVQGGIDLPEGSLGPRRLLFRADRVDEIGDASRWTDYKTGKPIDAGQKAETRAKHLLAGIARGEKLQAMAYAIGAGESGSGRYVFLRENVEAHKRVFAIDAHDAVAREAFDEAVDRLVAAFDMGVLFPRLLMPDLHRANGLCSTCEMAQACLRGDSGANRRLARFAAATEHDGDAEEVAFGLWSLASRKVEL